MKGATVNNLSSNQRILYASLATIIGIALTCTVGPGLLAVLWTLLNLIHKV